MTGPFDASEARRRAEEVNQERAPEIERQRLEQGKKPDRQQELENRKVWRERIWSAIERAAADAKYLVKLENQRLEDAVLIAELQSKGYSVWNHSIPHTGRSDLVIDWHPKVDRPDPQAQPENDCLGTVYCFALVLAAAIRHIFR